MAYIYIICSLYNIYSHLSYDIYDVYDLYSLAYGYARGWDVQYELGLATIWAFVLVSVANQVVLSM